jgi:NAD-dependent dihydropyrimidine dehydrogenase PreA subunit
MRGLRRMVGVLGGVLATGILVLWLIGERGRLMLPSTWRLMRELGWRRLINLQGPHAYVYGRWTQHYIGFVLNHVYPRVDARSKAWLADHFHAKVLMPEHARAIVTLNQDIPLQDLEQVIPYPLARNLVLHGPPDVAVFNCGCRQASETPCEPIQVCMAVGQPFVDFVLEHRPESRQLSQAEALELLEAEHERGHLHTAWFKDACLERFYAICNCCGCCCIGTVGLTRYGVPGLASSGYVAEVDQELCVACETCASACPFQAIRVNGTAAVQWEACLGCGVCVGQCSSGAITLVRDKAKGVPMDVRDWVPVGMVPHGMETAGG